MKNTFDTAARFAGMPLAEVEALLDSPYYEARMGAVSILDFKARRKRITDDERRALYDLYMERHDRIDNWDLVDRAAPRVVGWYLLDKPRAPLYELARSADIWERRTAITATFWFIRQGDIDDALHIAGLLLDDAEELIHKSVGTALREVGKVDQERLVRFLREQPALPGSRCGTRPRSCRRSCGRSCWAPGTRPGHRGRADRTVAGHAVPLRMPRSRNGVPQGPPRGPRARTRS